MVMQELKRGKNGTVFRLDKTKNGTENGKKFGMPVMSGGHRIGRKVSSLARLIMSSLNVKKVVIFNLIILATPNTINRGINGLITTLVIKRVVMMKV